MKKKNIIFQTLNLFYKIFKKVTLFPFEKFEKKTINIINQWFLYNEVLVFENK
jgi:hypothetical protein